MMFDSTVYNTVNWRNNLNDNIFDHDEDSDNELPLSSISDLEHPFGNNTTIRSYIQKRKSIDYQRNQKIQQDNILPHPSIVDVEHSFNDYKKIKHRSIKYETVDHQIELDINQDNELPLSSIADFLQPIDHKLQNSESQKCVIIDYQTEENNNKFIKCKTVDCQSKENSNHFNTFEPNRLICNEEQSTMMMDNPSKKYECDICSKIFSKRTDIIEHFKTSLCFPEIMYISIVFNCQNNDTIF